MSFMSKLGGFLKGAALGVAEGIPEAQAQRRKDEQQQLANERLDRAEARQLRAEDVQARSRIKGDIQALIDGGNYSAARSAVKDGELRLGPNEAQRHLSVISEENAKTNAEALNYARGISAAVNAAYEANDVDKVISTSQSIANALTKLQRVRENGDIEADTGNDVAEATQLAEALAELQRSMPRRTAELKTKVTSDNRLLTLTLGETDPARQKEGLDTLVSSRVITREFADQVNSSNAARNNLTAANILIESGDISSMQQALGEYQVGSAAHTAIALALAKREGNLKAKPLLQIESADTLPSLRLAVQRAEDAGADPEQVASIKNSSLTAIDAKHITYMTSQAAIEARRTIGPIASQILAKFLTGKNENLLLAMAQPDVDVEGLLRAAQTQSKNEDIKLALEEWNRIKDSELDRVKDRMIEDYFKNFPRAYMLQDSGGDLMNLVNRDDINSIEDLRVKYIVKSSWGDDVSLDFFLMPEEIAKLEAAFQAKSPTTSATSPSPNAVDGTDMAPVIGGGASAISPVIGGGASTIGGAGASGAGASGAGAGGAGAGGAGAGAGYQAPRPFTAAWNAFTEEGTRPRNRKIMDKTRSGTP